MSRASVLARGRAAAARGMVDACLFRRALTTTMDPVTGELTTAYRTVYEGPCRIQVVAQTAITGGHAVGDQEILQLWAMVQLPVADSEGIRERDEVRITACTHDADMVGRVMVVHEVPHKSEATTRRIGVRDRTPEE
jgi:hypothetical protein